MLQFLFKSARQFRCAFRDSSGALSKIVQVFRREVDRQFRRVYKGNIRDKSIKT
jgi:hypothetical protein